MKTFGYGWLLGKLERGRFPLPRDPDLLRHLAGLRYTDTSSGHARIEAETAATHDDLAAALLYAMGPYAVNGLQTSLLADVSRARTPDADAVFDPDESRRSGAGAGVGCEGRGVPPRASAPRR